MGVVALVLVILGLKSEDVKDHDTVIEENKKAHERIKEEAEGQRDKAIADFDDARSDTGDERAKLLTRLKRIRGRHRMRPRKRTK